MSAVGSAGAAKFAMTSPSRTHIAMPAGAPARWNNTGRPVARIASAIVPMGPGPAATGAARTRVASPRSGAGPAGPRDIVCPLVNLIAHRREHGGYADPQATDIDERPS